MAELIVVSTRTLIVLVVYQVAVHTPRVKRRDSLIHRLEDHVRFDNLDWVFMAVTVLVITGMSSMGLVHLD